MNQRRRSYWLININDMVKLKYTEIKYFSRTIAILALKLNANVILMLENASNSTTSEYIFMKSYWIDIQLL